MIPSVPHQLLMLIIAYTMLGFLILCLCLATRWAWWVKAAMVTLVSGFYIFSHQALQGISGWPTEDKLPERFVLLAAVFDEPAPQRHHDGAIYIWLNPMKDNEPLDMPRSYKLPYAKDLHEILGDGIKKARDGNTQMGSTEPKRGPAGFAWLRPAGNDQLQIKLSDLPRAQLPGK